MRVLCGILTLRKTFLLWRKFKIVVLVGCVEVGSISILQLGQSLLVNVAVSFIGLHFPPVESTYLSIATIYDMLHHHISLQFSNFFIFSTSPTRSHPLSLLCKHSSINAYRYFFSINSIFSWNSIPYNILSVSCHSCFQHSLYSFLGLN